MSHGALPLDTPIRYMRKPASVVAFLVGRPRSVPTRARDGVPRVPPLMTFATAKKLGFPTLEANRKFRQARIRKECGPGTDPKLHHITTFGHYLQRGGSILTMSLGFALSAVQDEAGTKSTWSLIPSV